MYYHDMTIYIFLKSSILFSFLSPNHSFNKLSKLMNISFEDVVDSYIPPGTFEKLKRKVFSLDPTSLFLSQRHCQPKIFFR